MITVIRWAASSRVLNQSSGRPALPPHLAFPFSPSRLLAPAELCARRLGPLVSHCTLCVGVGGVTVRGLNYLELG
jgi:hypothetical protein